MKKTFLISLIVMLFVSACAPNFKKEDEVVQQTDSKKEKAIIPKFSISDSYYRTILPFKAGEARGLVASNLNNRLDITEFETGLMRLAQSEFPADQYFYQEGQYLEKKTVQAWLKRKKTDQQLAEAQKESKDKKVQNLGLNPIDTGKGSLEERNKRSPIYLSHILEQDYLIKGDDEKLQLGGIMIGLALNSTHYYAEEHGYPREVKIKQEELEREGKKIAEEIIKRMREMEGLGQVPITIGLFKQMPKNSITPGNFFAVGAADKGEATIDNWEKIDEKYYLFPSSEATKDYRDDAMMFNEFKSKIEDYFPNFTSVIARGYYKDGQLQQMTVEIPIQFYGKGEVIGFTQYVAGLMLEHFPPHISTQVYITSTAGPESVIVREANKEKPFVHIYQ
ncbi:CamS family sex pheromone protein [Bacillus songklensis]|uniref:CamS family sex pheromone protein n=1 Tax=Bacillus songklensis TaxID=1069116 RepID=A0ABV8B7R7_9BACI